MGSVVVPVLIGAVAGAIDVAPMLLQGLDSLSCLSAFVFWCVQGLVIARVNLPVPAWLKGLLVAGLSALPIIILVAGSDPSAIGPMAVMSAILGTAVGTATKRFSPRSVTDRA